MQNLDGAPLFEKPSLSGLSTSQAQARLAAEGANELPQQKSRTLARIAIETIREPMFALLLASAIIYLILGSLEEALLLLFFACTSVGIAIVQEGRSERVLDALRDLTSPRALVIRDGMRRRIAGREVVRGDLIVLSEGDRIPADAIMREAEDLEADESLLTGEAVPVRKTKTQDIAGATALPGGDDVPFVFSGTLIVRGVGTAEVVATGVRSRIGQIGKSLAGIESTTPRLTAQTREVVRSVAIAGFVCCVIAVLLFGLYRGSWLQALLAGIALGMSMLPEEFPLVLTVFTVMGAWRLSRAHVLTRRAAAIETLGAATVLCTDKTGTLTENRMSIAQMRTADEIIHHIDSGTDSVSQSALHLVERGILASAAEPFDPMEKAFHALHARIRSDAPRAAQTLSKIYPLRPDFLAVAQAWAEPEFGEQLVAVKGAPETIISLCRLDAMRAQAIRRSADEMAASGARVLGIAEARHKGIELPENPRDFVFVFLGLVGLADPVRANVPDAVRECQSAGIRVVMITGDYPQTARAIGIEAGLASHIILTGAEIDSMSDDALADAAGRADIFARVMPEQKLRLVRALKKRGEVVAMTGDGVNDAPALRAADIGVAMGSRGTDVAREASSIVLLDDDFSSIVRTVRLGRRIYDNLRKAMGYILAVHIPIAGMALIPLLTGLPLVLAPVHIAFLEMVIDPVCSIVFEAEPEEGNIMRRAPRPANARLLSAGLIQWSLLQGCLALAIVAAIYIGGCRLNMPQADLRTLSFIALVSTNLSLVLVNRSFSAGILRLFANANPAFWLVAGIVTGLLGLAVIWPWTRSLFSFGTFHGHDLAVILLSVLALVLGLEAIKAIWPGRFQKALSG